ncbi:hypothetical protein KSB_30950 [Ktedonobacter robiniae]|uniref:Uncharacterized protein n=1 Tax=Ktedonobacter robiniae TaxID=2778365 RepID=A0ABQ3UPJ6_9CHLR|nr:hypothetical protein KSB_30950 [Ktedonobacter robiniae]
MRDKVLTNIPASSVAVHGKVHKVSMRSNSSVLHARAGNGGDKNKKNKCEKCCLFLRHTSACLQVSRKMPIEQRKQRIDYAVYMFSVQVSTTMRRLAFLPLRIVTQQDT